MRVATISQREIKKNCEQDFQKPSNRTLERYKFFSRKQNPKETLAHANWTSSKMRFQGSDSYTRNRRTTHKRHSGSQWHTKKEYVSKKYSEEERKKNEPVCAVSEQSNPCTRCGLVFTQNHRATCKVKNERCRNSSTIGHFDECAIDRKQELCKKRQICRKSRIPAN